MIWGINNTQAPIQANPGAQIALPVLYGLPNGAATNQSNAQATPTGQAAGAVQTSVVDVVNDFYWTYSPKTSRQEVPFIYLREKTLVVNALVSQLKYTLGFIPGQVGQAANNLANGIVSFAGAAGLSQYPDLFKDATATINGIATGTSNVISKVANAVNSRLPGTDNNTTVNNSTWLQPYNGLYITKPSGWEFMFPYFDDKFEMQGNQFSADPTNLGSLASLGQLALNLPTEVATLAGTINNPTKVSYIERAKFYNYPTDGDDITFSFPLINTGSVDYSDVVNNWQLIFLLLYNNKPGRISATTVDQPVIYEVEIPGVRFYPYCYISSIDVKFQGARRELQIPVPVTSQTLATNAAGSVTNVSTQTTTKNINTVIPDAYYVTITLKSMLANTKNFMYHMIDQGSQTVAGTVSGGSIATP